jgi:hypothetical protein
MTTVPGSHLGKPTKSYLITPELMAGSTPNFTAIYWGYFTVSSQEVSTMVLAISLYIICLFSANNCVISTPICAFG